MTYFPKNSHFYDRIKLRGHYQRLINDDQLNKYRVAAKTKDKHFTYNAFRGGDSCIAQ